MLAGKCEPVIADARCGGTTSIVSSGRLENFYDWNLRRGLEVPAACAARVQCYPFDLGSLRVEFLSTHAREHLNLNTAKECQVMYVELED